MVVYVCVCVCNGRITSRHYPSLEHEMIVCTSPLSHRTKIDDVRALCVCLREREREREREILYDASGIVPHSQHHISKDK